MIRIIIKSAKNKVEKHIEILAKIKEELKKNEISLEIIHNNNYDIDIIDAIPISFSDDINASAKTTDGSIQLNSNLLKKDFKIIMRYVIHELVHVFQHMSELKGNKEDEYLDNPDELEAFQKQIAYESNEISHDSAINYVDELIEYHEVPDEDKEKKKKELLKLTG